MMKNLRFFLLCMLMMLGGVAIADNVTVTFIPGTTQGNNTSASGQDSMTKDGITISTTSGGLAAAEYRFAKSSVTTISSTVGDITKIEFTCSASGTDKYGPGCFDAQDGYSYNGSNGVWTGDAASVSFTAGSAQVRATKIVVTVGEGSGEVTPEPDPEPQPVDEDLTGNGTLENPYTVADALIVTNKLGAGEKSAEKYYIKGVITSIKYTFSAQYGTATFDISDDESGANKFTAYSVYYLENKPWVEGYAQIEQGDEVILYGTVTNYGGTTPETATKEAYIYNLNGKTEAEGGEQPTEPTITGGTTPETAITVAAALEAINQLSDSQKTTGSYYVTGIVTALTEVSAQYGNATFDMADAEGQPVLTVFRAKGLNNENVTSENLLQVGDEVVVYGQLQKYVKDEQTTPELAQGGYIYSINGKTEADPEPPYTMVGDGSEQNPYTVADLKHTAVPADTNPVEGQTPVWVKGFIVGTLSSATAFSAEPVATNIALADDAAETTAANTIPVQLTVGSNIRASVNLLDNPDNKGKEVLVNAYVLKYFNVTGLKNVVDLIMDGQSQGVDGIALDAATSNAPIYNLAGQRIEQAQKGLYIQNGRKFVVK